MQGGVSPLALDVLSSVGARQHEVGVLAGQSPCHSYLSTLLLDVLFVVQAPTDNDEHVDLLSWIALVSREGARTRPLRYRSCRKHVTLWETGHCVFTLQASLC